MNERRNEYWTLFGTALECIRNICMLHARINSLRDEQQKKGEGKKDDSMKGINHVINELKNLEEKAEEDFFDRVSLVHDEYHIDIIPDLIFSKEDVGLKTYREFTSKMMSYNAEERKFQPYSEDEDEDEEEDEDLSFLS